MPENLIDPAGMGGALCIDPEAASGKQQAASLTRKY